MIGPLIGDKAREGTEMVILVTGASGFIGRRLVERLVREGDKTIYAASRAGESPQGAIGVRLDLCDRASFANLPESIDTVVHLAALIDSEDIGSYIDTNVRGTAWVLQYAAGAGASLFVHGSTGGLYGSSAVPFTEASPFRPQDDYALTKAQAEMLVMALGQGMVKVRLRYSGPYAIGTPNPLTRLVNRVIDGEEIEVIPGMYPRYCPLHVDDAVEMTVRCLELSSDVALNIAGTEVATFPAIALIAGEEVGREPRFKLVSPEETIPYYRSDFMMDGTAAIDLLNYRPKISLRDGIREMARDIKAARPPA